MTITVFLSKYNQINQLKINCNPRTYQITMKNNQLRVIWFSKYRLSTLAYPFQPNPPVSSGFGNRSVKGAQRKTSSITRKSTRTSFFFWGDWHLVKTDEIYFFLWSFEKKMLNSLLFSSQKKTHTMCFEIQKYSKIFF